MEKSKEKPSGGDNGAKVNSFALFAKMSVWIAVPVILASYLGSAWDNSHDSAPWGLLIAVGIAFPVSIAGLMIEASRAFRKISPEKEDNKNDYERDK